ncbi:MAG: cupredoxin domain-containing protein [Solirubrobacterales bacterium]
MRASYGLLLAGAVMLIAGLSGSSFAADDAGRTAPSADVAAVDAEGPEGVQLAPPEPETPAPIEVEGDRATPELETEAVETGEDEKGENPSAERRKSGSGEDKGEKQPLADVAVTIEDFEYRPDPVTVEPGEEVTWTNRDSAQHTATAEGKGDFDTGLLEDGQRGTVPFNEEGSFAYICTVHPDMKGKVVVRAGGSGGSGSNGTGGPSTTTDSTTPITPSGSSSDFSTATGGSTGSGSLPNTGQSQLPLLLLGAGLIVLGLLARAFHEHWIWR